MGVRKPHDEPAATALRFRGGVFADLTPDKERGGSLKTQSPFAAGGSGSNGTVVSALPECVRLDAVKTPLEIAFRQ